MERQDDFQERRKHLSNLSEDELKAKFWELIGEIVDPIADYAYKHTTPSIERSVLLRMGFSSIEATALVEGVLDRGLIGHGAGHIVYRIAKENNLDIRDAGLALVDGKYWDQAVEIFKGGEQ
ncbi:MAG: ornithine aminomutase subunit alpha [Tissierellia bacterium]|nr:ornithine aminomutase subunit alpha [Tissierellia bacterium]